MKLYAKTTSERASKGQGGNEYINIELMRGSAKNSKLCYKIHFNGKTLSILRENNRVIFQELAGDEIMARLEYLRQELRAERISYGELAELQSLAKYIPKNDTELLEAAGVPEFIEEKCDCNLNYGNRDLKGSHDIDCNSRKGEKQKGEMRYCVNPICKMKYAQTQAGDKCQKCGMLLSIFKG